MMAQMPDAIILRKTEETKTGVTYCMADVKTNADRIRSMSDEELAEWLDKLITHCNDGPCFNCFMQKACLTSMLDWLKQEANDVGQ